MLEHHIAELVFHKTVKFHKIIPSGFALRALILVTNPTGVEYERMEN